MANLTPITFLFYSIIIFLIALIVFSIIYMLKARKIRQRQEFFNRLNRFSRNPKKNFINEVKDSINKNK